VPPHLFFAADGAGLARARRGRTRKVENRQQWYSGAKDVPNTKADFDPQVIPP
jgi:hypothetical protein